MALAERLHRARYSSSAQRLSFERAALQAAQAQWADEKKKLTERSEALTKQVATRFHDSTIHEHFISFSSVAPGQTFDLEWKPSTSVRLATRLTLVPCSGGTLEFSLTTSPEKFKDLQQVLGAVLTSFAKSPGRK